MARLENAGQVSGNVHVLRDVVPPQAGDEIVEADDVTTLPQEPLETM
jgi:hypothetical protein